MSDRKKKDVEPFEQWEIEMVKRRARSLIGKFGYSASDLEDIEQEFFLSVFTKRSSYLIDADPKKAFKRIIEDQASRMIKKMKSPKRKIVSHSVSLDNQANPQDETTYAELISEDQAIGRLGKIDLSDEEEIRRDFEAVYRSLTPTQKKAYRMLEETKSKTDAAIELGINRKTLFEAIERIKEAFYRHGIIKKF